MTIMNDASAAMTLGELNKNISSLGKQLKKVSSGMRINSAGDDASGYSISEKMRVRIRALDQDERNVQNGAAMLRVAEGAVQQQIEIMKTIKEKVIDADNDTNTDLDRATIQKEIDQGYRQIQEIAWETNYNGKRLLVGDKKIDEIYTWKVVTPPETTPGSEMDIIPDVHYELDGVDDFFDILSTYSETTSTISPLFGSNTEVQLSGGGSTPSSFTMDFSGYTDVDQLEGLGFKTTSGSNYYVLTKDPSNHEYKTLNTASAGQPDNSIVAKKIDISGCTTVEQALERIAKTTILSGIETKLVPGTASTYTGTGTVIGKTVKLNKNTTNDLPAQPYFEAWKPPASTVDVATANPTGISISPATGTSGNYKVIGTNPDTDQPIWGWDPEPTAATLTQNMSGAAVGTGITIKNTYSYAKDAYIKFVAGNEGLKQQEDGSYTVGINATVTNQTLYTKTKASDGKNDYEPYVRFSLSGGQMTLTSSCSGAYTLSVTDGVNRGVSTWNYLEGNAYTGAVSNPSGGDPGTKASYSIDLTAYDVTDNVPGTPTLNTFIDELVGKAIEFRYYSRDSNPNYYSREYKYEFIDTTKRESMDAVRKTNISDFATIDLKQVRTKVQSGMTIADAFTSVMTSKNSSLFSDASGAGTKVLKVQAPSNLSGAEGNKVKLAFTDAKLGQYTVNFANYFQTTGTSIPDGLDGKGFRIYCATCPDQWFNFQFSAGEGDLDDTRPVSGSSGADLKTVIIDISDIDNVDDLVKKFYDTAHDAMQTIMHGQPHTLNLTADYENKSITFYDTRRFALTSSSFPNISEKHVAKLADGVLDDVQKQTRGIYVKDLVIQDTDHASQNIHVRIPQTTLDHLFNYIEGTRSISEFNVMTTASREMLLGNVKGERRTGGYTDHEEKGALDSALDYLTSANVLVGAQIMRLGMTEANIVTSRESTQNSESTLRDADMAKEMVGYTKANVLAQAAQSMLAQANQNSSAILGLLQ